MPVWRVTVRQPWQRQSDTYDCAQVTGRIQIADAEEYPAKELRQRHCSCHTREQPDGDGPNELPVKLQPIHDSASPPALFGSRDLSALL